MSGTLPASTSPGPSPLRTPQGSMRWWVRFLAFWALVLVIGSLVRLTNVSPLAVAATTAAVWVALRFVVARFDDVAPPIEPRRQTASMPRVRSEPARMIPDLADACVICGRKLTNIDSRRARVGTDCIKRYGSRQRDIANPDHDLWNEEMAQTRVVRAERQVALDREHAQAIVTHRLALTSWAAKVSTPEGASRYRTRRWITTIRTLVGIAFWVAVPAHFAL